MTRSALLAATILMSSTGSSPASAQEPPRIVASIAPVQALVAGVTDGVAEPTLLMDPTISPHDYTLRPSEGRMLQQADVVFWIGPGMEQVLDDALTTLAADAVVVELAEVPGVVLLPRRTGAAYERHVHGHDDHGHDDHGHDDHGHDDHAHDDHAHDDHGHDDHGHDDHAHGDHGHDDHAHDHDGADMHLWLEPANAIAWTRAVAETLAEIDPSHADLYRANADARIAEIDAVVAEVAETVAPVHDRPFLVFHDAYQYFERRFGLAGVGSITLNPEVPPSPRRIYEVAARLEEAGAVCVFAEPQFDRAVVDVVIEGTDTAVGILDPLGSAMAENGDLTYPALLRQLAGDLVDCLS